MAQFHSAFTYFAAAYGVKIVATFEPSPGASPDRVTLKLFYDRCRRINSIRFLSNPSLIRAPLQHLARDLGVSLKILDPLGGTKGREHYIDMMRFNAAQMASTLRN